MRVFGGHGHWLTMSYPGPVMARYTPDISGAVMVTAELSVAPDELVARNQNERVVVEGGMIAKEDVAPGSGRLESPLNPSYH